MIKTLSIIFVNVLLVSLNCFGKGADSNKGFNFYLAAGQNLSFPSSVRVGWSRWEFGLLDKNFVGFNKTFPISGSRMYAGFGIGTNTDPFPSSLGIQGSVGFNYEIFWNIGLRGELIAIANLNGTTISHGLLGISYGF